MAGLDLHIFFDSGCGDLVIRKDCVGKLMRIGRAAKEYDGRITLNGVGNQKSICHFGIYSIRIPLKDGAEAKMSGVCVDVTLPFPKYPLQVVEQDIRREVGKSNKNLVSKLPKLPREVGSQVDLMIGKHYLRYFPLEITRLTPGLTLYNSMYKSIDGSTGVVRGHIQSFQKLNVLLILVIRNCATIVQMFEIILLFFHINLKFQNLGMTNPLLIPTKEIQVLR